MAVSKHIVEEHGIKMTSGWMEMKSSLMGKQCNVVSQ
jgi:hypothetical protein